MSRAVRSWSFGAALLGAAVAAACTELPAAHEFTLEVDIALVVPDSVIVGDTTVLTAVVRDALGNRIASPPLTWGFGNAYYDGSVQVIRAKQDSMWVVGVT